MPRIGSANVFKLWSLMFVLSVPLIVLPQKMSEKPQINVKYFSTDLAVSDLTNDSWNMASAAQVDRYWNGKEAPEGRRMTARLLWSATAIYVRFKANQKEPLVISERAEVSKKAMKLWDRDVVEIFLAPDKNERRKYFEFEAAPNGEWLDVALDSRGGKRISDWEYRSGMESAANIEDGKVVIAMKIPWSAFGKKPNAGDVWLGNLLRCVGKDPDRGYLAWSSTMTDQPNFHVPERFGEFHFLK